MSVKWDREVGDGQMRAENLFPKYEENQFRLRLQCRRESALAFPHALFLTPNGPGGAVFALLKVAHVRLEIRLVGGTIPLSKGHK